MISAFVFGTFAAVVVYGAYTLASVPSFSEVPIYMFWSGIFLFGWKYRSALRRLPPITVVGVVAIEALSLGNAWMVDHARSREARNYDLLAAAVRADNLRAVDKMLAQDSDPDFLPPAAPFCALNGPCHYEKRERPINIAIARGNLLIANALLARGAVIVPEDGDGIEAAALRGDLPTVKFLIDHGVLVNVRDGKSVALWNAVSANQPEIVSLLLDAGASPDSWWSSGDNGESISALTLAKRTNARGIVLLLRRAGATE